MSPSVVHVLWSLEAGGAERAVYQLVREQRRRGREADVLVGGTAGFYGDLLVREGANVHELRQRGALDPRARRAADICNRYPIVHFHGREPLLVAIAARQTNPRLFYTHRGGSPCYPFKKRVRHMLIGHYLRRRFDGIAANTHHGAKAAARIYRLPIDRIQVVYNGFDFTLLAPRRPRDAVFAELGDERPGVVRIGTAAILRPLKRVDRLVKALAALCDLPVHCYVFGDGPSRAELEMLAFRRGLAERVTFTGHKTHVGDYLQLLDIFVLPSGPEESFGNAAVEAMALGVPTVVFADGGGLTEHIEDRVTGIVVAGQSDLEQRLRELVDDAHLRRRLAEAARDSVRRRYTVESMVAAYDAFYDAAGADGAHGDAGAALHLRHDTIA
jgi:glycosyltransferase involved in cell wall biosynthesis